MTSAEECIFNAAEGITFSGKIDCRPIALWRSSFNWVPKGQGLVSNLSGKRTEYNFTPVRYTYGQEYFVLCFFKCSGDRSTFRICVPTQINEKRKTKCQ